MTEIDRADALVAVDFDETFDAFVQMAGGDAVADGEGGFDEGREIVAGADDFAIDGMVFRNIVVTVEFFVCKAADGMVLDDDAVGKFILRIILQILMPRGGQEGEELFLHLLLLVFFDELVQFFNGFFHWRCDVTREDFGQVVEKSAPEIVDDALFAGSGVLHGKICKCRDDKHVAKNGRDRNARRLRPSLLEAELSAQFHETGCFAFQGDLLDTEQVVVVFYLVLDLLADLLRSPDERAHLIEDVELPLSGKEMGGLENTFFLGGIGLVEKIAAEAFIEAATDLRQLVLQVASHPFVEFVAELGHHLVEDRRFYISQDNSVEHLEETAFDKMKPVDGAWCLVLLEARRYVCDDHFVGLLVQLGEIHRIDLVVPTADASGVVKQFNQTWIEGGFSHRLPSYGESFS